MGDNRSIPCDSSIGRGDPGSHRYTVLVTTYDPNEPGVNTTQVEVWANGPIHIDDLRDRAAEAASKFQPRPGSTTDPPIIGPNTRVEIRIIAQSRAC